LTSVGCVSMAPSDGLLFCRRACPRASRSFVPSLNPIAFRVGGRRADERADWESPPTHRRPSNTLGIAAAHKQTNKSTFKSPRANNKTTKKAPTSAQNPHKRTHKCTSNRAQRRQTSSSSTRSRSPITSWHRRPCSRAPWGTRGVLRAYSRVLYRYYKICEHSIGTR
jgi:hypothetical protein